jgi:pimeloyl-ACP methyl ester carboxylesterase
MADTAFMIHGMWGGAWCWSNFREVFERAGYNCVATTLRFHDMDPQAAPDPRLGTTSLLDYAADLEREIRALDTMPIILGHSMGGLLAQILASRGLGKALVLLVPASPAGINAIRPSVIRSFWSAQTKPGFWKRPMRQTFNEAVYSMLQLLPAEARRDTYRRFVYESGRAASEIGYWPLDRGHASRVDEAKISCPMLVIGAALDRITPAAVVRRVAHKYRRSATYKEFTNHAHWLLGEPGWEEVAEHVLQWLKGPGTQRAPTTDIH